MKGSGLSPPPLLLLLLQDRLLGRGKDAVQPPEHREWEDDAAVLGLAVVAAEEVGDRPDERGKNRSSEDVNLQSVGTLAALNRSAEPLSQSPDYGYAAILAPCWRGYVRRTGTPVDQSRHWEVV